ECSRKYRLVLLNYSCLAANDDDIFRLGAYFELQVCTYGIGTADHRIHARGFKAGRSDGNFIRTRFQGRHFVISLAVGGEVSRETGRLVGHLHRSVGQDSTIGVSYRAPYCSQVTALRVTGFAETNKYPNQH